MARWLLALCCALPSFAGADSLPIEGPFRSRPEMFLARWDPVREVLLAHRLSTPEEPDAIAVLSQGRPATTVAPIRDFPGAYQVAISDVSATPRGGVVASAVVNAGTTSSPTARHVILRYGPTGQLEGLWDVYPYHHHFVSVDEAGDVFALGHQVNRPSGATYPLLVKYSADGSVAWEALSSSLFGSIGDDILQESSTDRNLMLLLRRGIFILVGSRRELLWLNRNGDVVSRKTLKTAGLVDTGERHDHFLTMAATSPEQVLMQFVVAAGRSCLGAHKCDVSEAELVTAWVEPDGGVSRRVQVEDPRARLLAVDSSGRPLFLAGDRRRLFSPGRGPTSSAADPPSVAVRARGGE